jgi:hypothetical protein
VGLRIPGCQYDGRYSRVMVTDTEWVAATRALLTIEVIYTVWSYYLSINLSASTVNLHICVFVSTSLKPST